MWRLQLTLYLTLCYILCSFAFMGMKRIWRVSSARLSNVAESGGTSNDRLVIDLGVLKISGDDRLKFIHGLTTNSFLEGTQSSVKAITADFLNSKGKLVDHNMFILSDGDVLVLCEPESTTRLFKYIDNYIFPADKVSIADVSTSYTAAYTTSQELAAVSMPIKDIHPISRVPLLTTIEGQLSDYFQNSYLSLIPILKETVSSPKDVTKSSLILHQVLRCVLGRPSFPHEIQAVSPPKVDGEVVDKKSPATLLRQYDTKFTPFELGIADSSVLLNKGCYTGQEVVSRAVNSLSSSDDFKAKGSALRQMMQSLEIINRDEESDEISLLPPGTVILDKDGEEVGIVTSSIAYILNNILHYDTTTSLTPTKVSLKVLKQQLLDQLQADNIAESTPKLYDIIITEGYLEQLLRRVLAMTRVRFIDDNKEGYSCSILGNEGFNLVRRAEQPITLPYLDYRFEKLLSANTAQQTRITQVKQQQQPQAPSFASGEDGESEKEKEKRRIAEKMEKQRQQVEALLAKRKKATN